jgi:hypothetical protein
MLKRIANLILLSALSLHHVGCGYFSSGKWEDDPQNWKRAWGYSKPSEIVMIHSWYWRSPHWTREEAYFFQFKWHKELFQQLVDRNGMHLSKDGSGKKIQESSFCFDKPAWFIPRLESAYEIWEGSNCLLFKDKSANEIFLYACQL